MKVKIITCNRANNYGARLQAYALWRHIATLGHESTVIDYCPQYLDFYVRLMYFPGCSIKEWVKLVVRYPERRCKTTKFAHLEEFSNTMTQLTPVRYTSIDQLRDTPPQADVYIAGSDQIWNTTFQNGLDPAFYLDFGDENIRRISYAASFATEGVESRHTDFLRQNLSRFDAVSVREESGKTITERLDIPASICCDPAFLLDHNDWDEICAYNPVGTRFLFVYDFERSPEIKAVAKKLAKARRLKIYAVSERPLGYADRDFSDCSPSTFLWLIKNADCVLSNSLHGSIFSIIYKRDFFVVNRADGLNARMADLMERYGLQQRILTPDSEKAALIRHIDYDTIDGKLAGDIIRSKEWLSTNLTARQ